jgi:hypothetical protein
MRTLLTAVVGGVLGFSVCAYVARWDSDTTCARALAACRPPPPWQRISVVHDNVTESFFVKCATDEDGGVVLDTWGAQ